MITRRALLSHSAPVVGALGVAVMAAPSPAAEAVSPVLADQIVQARKGVTEIEHYFARCSELADIHGPFSDELAAFEEEFDPTSGAFFELLRSVLAFPCASLIDAGAKAKLFLDGPMWLREALENGEHVALLRSLIREEA